MVPRIVVAALAVVLLGAAAVALVALLLPEAWQSQGNDTYTVEHTDYTPPAPPEDDGLTDDTLDDRQPGFDPGLIDRRPLGPQGEWSLNASAAVLRLDVPLVKPDVEADLLTLHPSYAAAIGRRRHGEVLPSVNLIDGKAKQFDDGLYAALDQAYYRGLEGRLLGHVELVRRLHRKVGRDSVAAPFLAAGLSLAGVNADAADLTARDKLLDEFQSNEVRSKPVGFYTWNETLSSCFRFLRFFQKAFDEGDLAVPQALAKALHDDPALLADYRKAVAFYARLTNPYRVRTVADLVSEPGPAAPPKGGPVALFPASTSKETVLFERLFPLGLPPDADLMGEFVRAIRSGRVDLAPRPDSGWYDHQVYALEALLLPEKGEGHDHLLLTRSYKKRMLEAFQALVSKRRETHVRQLEVAKSRDAAPPPLEVVRPRLRVEPNPSYYLRTARAYAFLANVLEASLGAEALKTLHGLKQGGERAADLDVELHTLRDLFYGLYLVSAEDIGLKPAFAAGEAVDQTKCYGAAEAWLRTALADEDLAVDTRVAVPVYVDATQGVTRVWATLGVRLTRLEASYARPPHVKPVRGEGPWQAVEGQRLRPAEYLIPVDEFAEVELRGLKVLTREELRAVCDREKTRVAILNALRR